MSESPKIRRRTNSKSDKKRPSFSSPSSPWVRRNSFLSPSMIHSENISVYESPNYYHDCSSYNIISLKECQGFIFNQDLFASPYQQLKSLANERKYRSSFSHKSKSRSNSNSIRRHTSVNLELPNFSNSILQGTAIDDEDDIDVDSENEINHEINHEIKNEIKNDNEGNGNGIGNSNGNGNGNGEERECNEDRSLNQAIDQFENTTVDISISDEEFSEYEELNESYKIRVTEIIVNDNEELFPN